jgi:hypothetical protein
MAGQLFAVDGRYQPPTDRNGYLPAYERLPPKSADVSLLRRCFGDEGVVTITLDVRFETPRVQRVFPEATILVRPPEPMRMLPTNEPQEQRSPVASFTVHEDSWS